MSTASPYLVHVGSLLRRPGSMEELSFDLTVPEPIGVPMLGLAKGSTLHLDARLERLVDGVLATVDVQGELTGQCSRCLRDISEPYEGHLAELYGSEPDEALDYFVEGDQLDLEGPIRDAVVLDLPFQPLCEPDCLGLDPTTGERLTEPLPEAEAEVDPRWAALKGLTPAAEGDASTRA